MENIQNAIDIMYKNQGYVDVTMVSTMSRTPGIIVENVLKNSAFKESGIPGQWVKERTGE